MKEWGAVFALVALLAHIALIAGVENSYPHRSRV
jgi:hypothetical protein